VGLSNRTQVSSKHSHVAMNSFVNRLRLNIIEG
jgi:hypothetical protein